MAVTWRSVSHNSGGSLSSIALTKPAGLAVDDILVAVITIPASNVAVTPSASGFAIEQSHHRYASFVYLDMIVLWKRATSGDVAASDFTFSWSGSYSCSGALHAFSGAIASGNPFTGSAIESINTNPIPSITYTAGNGLGIWACSTMSWADTITIPSGYTSRSSVSQGSLNLATRADTAGSTSTGTASHTAVSNNIVISFAGTLLPGSGSSPKINTLTEDFSTGIVDSGKWNVTDGSGTMSQTGGQLVINMAPNLVSYTTDEYESVNTYDLTNSQLVIEVPQFPNPYQGAEQKVLLQLDYDNYIRFAADGYYYNLELVTGGIGDAGYVDPLPTTDRWWRIRESSGTIYWDSSADGANWTNLRSVSATFSLTALTVVLGAGCWQSVANPGTIKFDNLNLAPTLPVYRNTAEGQTSGTVTEANSGGGSGRAFDVVDTTGTINQRFTNARSIHGSCSYAITPTGSAGVVYVFENQADAVGAQQAYFYFTAYPSGTCAVIGTYSTDTKSTMAITSSGAVAIYDDNGLLTQSASGVIPVNTWVRFDMITTIGTTTSNGRIQAKLSLEDDTVSVFNYDSGATVNVGTVPIESYLYGKLDNSPTIATYYIDDIAYQPLATGYIVLPAGKLYRNSAEGGSNSTAVTTGNSGGGSGDAFPIVTNTGTPVNEFTSTQIAHGSLAYHISGISTDRVNLHLGDSSGTMMMAYRYYIYLPAIPTATTQLSVLVDTDYGSAGYVSIDSAGKLRVFNDAGTNVYTCTASLSTATWYRIDHRVIVAGSTTGTIDFQFSAMDSLTPIESFNTKTTDNGTARLMRAMVGKNNAGGSSFDIYYDDIAIQSSATRFIPPIMIASIAWFVA